MICYSNEEHPTYCDANYRRGDDKEETFKADSSTKEVQVTKPYQVVDNIVSCSVLLESANHHLTHIDSQSYVDETLKKESSSLDVTDETFLKDDN